MELLAVRPVADVLRYRRGRTEAPDVAEEATRLVPLVADDPVAAAPPDV
jgi:hypothetical protein